MELTGSLVEEKADEYRDVEPLYSVETEHVEMLRGTFASGEYGWRDAEWVVQWYFRRYLGAYPDEERRDTEQRFRDNDFDDVVDALSAILDDGGVAEKLDRLTGLEGVDVPVASAFLLFLFPERYVVVGDREWTVLCEAGELDEPYPDPPSRAAYLTYQETCRGLCERFDVDAWTLYRALWRLWSQVEENSH
ncbi:hypothetical protein BRC65_02465 [Halobacteriales archaeon QH_2_65_14]|nr:MAG: hypothetical protein BRC65_02465 [Halobacteriales archaeon QH_2_65_14]